MCHTGDSIELDNVFHSNDDIVLHVDLEDTRPYACTSKYISQTIGGWGGGSSPHSYTLDSVRYRELQKSNGRRKLTVSVYFNLPGVSRYSSMVRCPW